MSDKPSSFKNRYRTDADFRKKVIQKSVSYYLSHKEDVLAYRRKHYQLNKDRYKQNKLNWKLAHGLCVVIPDNYMSSRRARELLKISRERLRQIRFLGCLKFKKLSNRTFIYLETSVRGYMGGGK